MSIALSMPLVLSAVRALMRYRDRVDRVLALSTATEGLPFDLPPVPQDPATYFEPMRIFFRTADGQTVLAVNGLRDGFNTWDEMVRNKQPVDNPDLKKNWRDCSALYVRSVNLTPYLLQPDVKNPGPLAKYAKTGPGDDVRLAYYIVESDRVSRNSTLTRVLLITADTLLEFLGENANTFISNPRTSTLVESLIEGFAKERDFDDDSAQQIFRSLLGAGVSAALDHPELLPNKPVLSALYGAINDVRKEIKIKQQNDGKAYDTIAALFGQDGLERIGRFFMVRVSTYPSIVVDGPRTAAAVKTVLTELVAMYDANGGKFRGLLDDSAARARIVEVLVEIGAGRTSEVLQEKAKSKPFTALVLKALVDHVAAEADNHRLFKSVAQGEIVGDLYGIALAAVAKNGKALTDEAQVDAVVAELIATCAAALEGTSLQTGADERRDRLVSAALKVLANHPEVITTGHKFGSAVIAATLQAAAQGAADGFTKEDLESVLDAALKAAGENAGLTGMNEAQAAALRAITVAIADTQMASLESAAARKALMLAALGAVNASPKVWDDEETRKQLQPLIAAIIAALREGRAKNLLSDSGLLDAFKVILGAANQRGKALLARAGVIDDLQAMLLKALDLAREEIGRSISQDRIPALLQRVTLAYLKSPFVLAQVPEETVNRFFNDIREWLDQR